MGAGSWLAPWLLTGVAAAASPFWPGPRRPPGPPSASAACAGCHADIAAEQAASFHARSWSDPMFQRSYEREPQAFCRDCHAPAAAGLASSARTPGVATGALTIATGSTPAQVSHVTPSAAAAGISCTGCHGEPAAPLAAPAGEHAGRAPHALRRDERFGSPAACAGCHEFTFPDAAWRHEPGWMQSTAAEHAASPYADRACASCHMPLVDGPRGPHRSHAFASPRDPSALRAAVAVDALRDPDGRVWIALSVDDVGHAFPTGDLFRRLEVAVEAIGPDHAVVASQRRLLARHWGRVPGVGGLPVRAMLVDDRPRPGRPALLRLDLGLDALPWPVAYRVTYQRPIAVRDDAEDAAEIHDELLLAEGTLPPALAP